MNRSGFWPYVSIAVVTPLLMSAVSYSAYAMALGSLSLSFWNTKDSLWMGMVSGVAFAPALSVMFYALSKHRWRAVLTTGFIGCVVLFLSLFIEVSSGLYV